MSKKDTTPEPMDSGAKEIANPTMALPNARVCYAAQTLAAEVTEAFPETPVEYSNPNGRNVSLDVSFDLTSLDPHDADDLAIVLRLLDTDQRVLAVMADESSALVSFRNNAITQDLRDSFNVADALAVMDEPVDYMGGSI